MLSAAQSPLCSATEPSCGWVPPSGAGDVGDVADRVDARRAVDRQVGLRRRSGRRGPAAGPRAAASGGAMMPPPQTTQRVLIVVPSASVDVAGADLRDRRSPRCIRTPLRVEHLGDVVVRLVGERRQQRVAEVDDVHLRRADGEVVVLDGHRLVDQVGERAGHLDAGRARRRR